jgi:hypothetical protein
LASAEIRLASTASTFSKNRHGRFRESDGLAGSAGDLPLPQQFAVVHIKRNQEAIGGSTYYTPIFDRDAAISVERALSFNSHSWRHISLQLAASIATVVCPIERKIRRSPVKGLTGRALPHSLLPL